jgi:hypothetical protein
VQRSSAPQDIAYAETAELEKLRHHLAGTESPMRPQLEPALERWRTAAAELEGLLGSERKALEDARETLASMQDRLEARAEEIATLTNLLRGRGDSPKNSVDSNTQRKLDVSTRELATLSKLLRTAEDSANWLRDIHSALWSCPWWWGVMPVRWQRRKRAERLRRKGLFDAKAYLRRYPDVAQEGVDPLRHYILCGQAEGRLR